MESEFQPEKLQRDSRPDPPISYPDLQRWLNIAVRTSHIAVAAVFFGGSLLGVPFVGLSPWFCLSMATGGILLALEWLHDRRWPHRGKGLLVHFHLALCLLLHLLPAFTVPLLWLILVSGSIGSHMPRRFRHWSILEGPEQRW